MERKNFTVRILANLIEKVKRQAKKEKRSVNMTVENILEQAINEQK